MVVTNPSVFEYDGDEYETDAGNSLQDTPERRPPIDSRLYSLKNKFSKGVPPGTPDHSVDGSDSDATSRHRLQSFESLTDDVSAELPPGTPKNKTVKP
eukprot:UN12735